MATGQTQFVVCTILGKVGLMVFLKTIQDFFDVVLAPNFTQMGP